MRTTRTGNSLGRFDKQFWALLISILLSAWLGGGKPNPKDLVKQLANCQQQELIP